MTDAYEFRIAGQLSADLLASFEPQEWRDEVPRIGRWFDTFGWRLPRDLVDELRQLEAALGQPESTFGM